MIVVYSYYVMDLIHKGHLEMLRNAKAMAGPTGRLIVGILTDAAVMEKKPKPLTCFDDRVELVRSIECVDLVVAQETYSPLPNVRKLKPDVLMESSSHTDEAIQEAKDCVAEYGGKVIVIPYFPGYSSTGIKEAIKDLGGGNGNS